MVVKQRMAETASKTKANMGLKTIDKGGMASCLSHLPSGDDSYAQMTPAPPRSTTGSHMGRAAPLALESRLARRPDTHQGASRNHSAQNTATQFVPLTSHYRSQSRTRNYATPGVSREQQQTGLGVTTGINVADFLKMYS